jgi:GT2 family glycosyltransferase
MIKISVVIPCRNEVKFIEECIDAIYTCTLPESTQLKVFVVDGMSDDGTRDLVKQLMHKYSDLFLIDNLHKLTPFAFNKGIKESGEVDFVQIVGARHIISSNYIIECFHKLNNNPSIWCVGGKIQNEYLNQTGFIISQAMSTKFGMGLGNFRTLEKSGFTDTVTSPMYPYWLFEEIGYFDEELIRNQDDDFNFRVIKAGGKIFYIHEISLKYYVRGNYKGLWRQFFQYGYWKVYVNRKHKTLTTLRQVIPACFIMYLITLPIITLFSLKTFLLLSIFLVIYIILAVVFAMKLVINNQKLPFLQTFITFPTLHFSYGLGYLQGIFEFLVLGKKPAEKQKRLSR